MGDAIRNTGSYLGHFHIGECNRKVPGKGHMPWAEMGQALCDIGYDGCRHGAVHKDGRNGRQRN